MQSKTKSVAAKLEKAGNGSFVLSSSNFDREDDRIDVKALVKAASDLPKLITLWQHKADQPIGFWENLRVEGKRLIGDLRLASTNLAAMVKQLLDDDVPLGASIGFMGMGQFNDKGGIDFEDIELLECSVVSVPANPDAIRIAKSFGVNLVSLEEMPLAVSGLAASSDAILKAKSAIIGANKVVRLK